MAYQFDTSASLYIQPHLNGIRLIQPRLTVKAKNLFTVKDALDLPCNVYFLNRDSEIKNINEISASSSGYLSTQDAIGRTVFDTLTPENANRITAIDKEVVTNNCKRINEDIMIRKDGTMMNFITVKTPIYNEKNLIVGIFGCSAMLGNHPIAESLALMMKMGLLNDSKNAVKGNLNFTPREYEIAQLLTQGKTAREIAGILYLSL